MGYNNYGQLGNGTTSNTNQPIIVAGNVVAVAAGYDHSLFVTADGTLWAMGYNVVWPVGQRHDQQHQLAGQCVPACPWRIFFQQIKLITPWRWASITMPP